MACPLADQRADIVTLDKTLVEVGAQLGGLCRDGGAEWWAIIQRCGELRLSRGYAHVCSFLRRR